jgi:hypothetical protein
MPSSEMWCRVGLVGIDVSEQRVASILSVERIREPRGALAVGFFRIIYDKKQTPWPLVRKRTIPTERPHLSTKFNFNFCE